MCVHGVSDDVKAMITCTVDGCAVDGSQRALVQGSIAPSVWWNICRGEVVADA